MTAALPIAHALARTPSTHLWSAVVVEIRCPYCTATHYHPGAATDHDHGTHFPPCRAWLPEAAAGYVVRESPATTPNTGDLLDLLDGDG